MQFSTNIDGGAEFWRTWIFKPCYWYARPEIPLAPYARVLRLTPLLAFESMRGLTVNVPLASPTLLG
jgi:hypothetical protein